MALMEEEAPAIMKPYRDDVDEEEEDETINNAIKPYRDNVDESQPEEKNDDDVEMFVDEESPDNDGEELAGLVKSDVELQQTKSSYQRIIWILGFVILLLFATMVAGFLYLNNQNNAELAPVIVPDRLPTPQTEAPAQPAAPITVPVTVPVQVHAPIKASVPVSLPGPKLPVTNVTVIHVPSTNPPAPVASPEASPESSPSAPAESPHEGSPVGTMENPTEVAGEEEEELEDKEIEQEIEKEEGKDASPSATEAPYPASPTNMSLYNATVLSMRQDPPAQDTLVKVRNPGTTHSTGHILKGANVEWMLDFAILGYPKCGTSFLKMWLSRSPQIYMDDHEVMGMAQNKPWQVVKHLSGVIEKTKQPKNNRIGIKHPGDIDSIHALGLFEKFFPNTKFVVLTRHPVLWFQSFYNFRYRAEYNTKLQKQLNRPHNKGRSDGPHDRERQLGEDRESTTNGDLQDIHDKIREFATPQSNDDDETSSQHAHTQFSFNIGMPAPSKLVGSCFFNDESNDHSCLNDPHCNHSKRGVCTNRAQFHHGISRLGLTPMNTEEEWELLDHHSMTVHPTSQPVLFLELTQFDDPDIEEDVRETLRSFVGVEDMPPIEPYVTPYEKAPGEIDICEDNYKEIRELLVGHGTRASRWIQEYLLKSDKVMLASKDSFVAAIQKWSSDPCVEQ